MTIVIERFQPSIIRLTLLKSTWPRNYKTIFKLSSAEHEICSANRSQTIANSFSPNNIAEQDFFSAIKYENANYYCYFHIY